MPKPTKLHARSRPKSMQKSAGPQKDTVIEDDDKLDHETATRQFELELCWCIQELKKIVGQKNASENQQLEAWKALAVLQNNNQSLIRKRQLMRTFFGDYRAKMAAEEKKLVKMARKMKIVENPTPKATFLRKSVFMTTGEGFKFDFKVEKDQVNTDKNQGDKNQEDNQDNGDKLNTSESKSQEGAIENPTTVELPTDSSGGTKPRPLIANPFKYKANGAEFKFNFDVET